MTELKNDRFLRALQRQPVDRTPLWMMRQAGRYLPEYRATREQAGSFMDLCKNAELACEVTLQPLRRYPMDAAILFSDILTIPDALGLGLYFETGEGPRFSKTVRSEEDLAGSMISGRGRPRLRHGRGAHDPPRAQRLRAPDRLQRLTLDPGHLHGRGRLVQGFCPRQDHGLRPAGADARTPAHVLADAVADYLTRRSTPVPRPCRSSTPGAAV
jgi:hypothetical protein